MSSSNLRVWKYFTWILVIIAFVLVLVSRPNTNQLDNTKTQIKSTSLAIRTAKKEASSPNNRTTKSFNIVMARQKAIKEVTSGLEMAVGGFSNATEYQAHEKQLQSVFGRQLTQELYKLNGSPDKAYDAPDNAKFKFEIKEKADVTVGSLDVSDPSHARLIGIFSYKPKYLNYGLIKIIDLDYNLRTQHTNEGKISNIKNPQLSGYYETD